MSISQRPPCAPWTLFLTAGATGLTTEPSVITQDHRRPALFQIFPVV